MQLIAAVLFTCVSSGRSICFRMIILTLMKFASSFLLKTQIGNKPGWRKNWKKCKIGDEKLFYSPQISYITLRCTKFFDRIFTANFFSPHSPPDLCDFTAFTTYLTKFSAFTAYLTKFSAFNAYLAYLFNYLFIVAWRWTSNQQSGIGN